MKATDGARSFFETIIEDGKHSCFMLRIYTESLEWGWSLILSTTTMECANYTHKSKCLCVLCMPMMFVCVVHAYVCGMVVPRVHEGLLMGMWYAHTITIDLKTTTSLICCFSSLAIVYIRKSTP